MHDGGNTCTPVGSGAVDEQFWALICEDEDWLDREFEEIVSEPAESPRLRRRRGRWCVSTGPVPRGTVRAVAGAERDTRAVQGSVPGGRGGGNAHRPGRKALTGNRFRGKGRWFHRARARGGGVRSPARLTPCDADNPADGDKAEGLLRGHRIQRLVTLVQRVASAMSPAPKGGHRMVPGDRLSLSALCCPADCAHPAREGAWRHAGRVVMKGVCQGGRRCAITPCV